MSLLSAFHLEYTEILLASLQFKLVADTNLAEVCDDVAATGSTVTTACSLLRNNILSIISYHTYHIIRIISVSHLRLVDCCRSSRSSKQRRKGRKKTKGRSLKVFSRDPVEATSRLNIPLLTGGSGVQDPCYCYSIQEYQCLEDGGFVVLNYKSYSSHSACKP